MRPIDADNFLDLFYVASAGQDKAFVAAVEMVVEDTPTIDAEPVRHGEWKEASGCRIICNNCGHYPLYDYFGRLKLSPYCWFCGVKMGGDKVGEGN